MGFKQGVDYTKDEIIQEVYNCAMNVFGEGIAVPSLNHPCGWDWLDFKEVDDILTYEFMNYDISNGVYDSPEQEGRTLKEILIAHKGRFLFEINTNINWED